MKIECKESKLTTSSFVRLSAAEVRVSRMCVEFWFSGLETFFLYLGFLAFECGLFQLLRVNRELAYFIPFAHKVETLHLNLYAVSCFSYMDDVAEFFDFASKQF
jgi:hypothetical protein